MTSCGTFQQSEGVGSDAGESVSVQDLFGEGADQRLAAELAVEIFLGPVDDVVDVEGAFGREEYVIHDLHVRLAFGFGRCAWALLGAAQSTQGAELRQGGIFKNFNEVVFIQWIHKIKSNGTGGKMGYR